MTLANNLKVRKTILAVYVLSIATYVATASALAIKGSSFSTTPTETLAALHPNYQHDDYQNIQDARIDQLEMKSAELKAQVEASSQRMDRMNIEKLSEIVASLNTTVSYDHDLIRASALAVFLMFLERGLSFAARFKKTVARKLEE